MNGVMCNGTQRAGSTQKTIRKTDFILNKNIPKRVVVGSLNPVKVNSTTQAFHTLFPNTNWVFTGVDIASGVSNQPMTDEETLQGAMNRALRVKKQHPKAHYWVGIEGGCEEKFGRVWVFAWIVIRTENRIEMARTSAFCLPNDITILLDQGMELGDATDIAFYKHNSKHHDGIVGVLSQGHIDRTAYYVQPIILALMHTGQQPQRTAKNHSTL